MGGKLPPIDETLKSDYYAQANLQKITCQNLAPWRIYMWATPEFENVAPCSDRHKEILKLAWGDKYSYTMYNSRINSQLIGQLKVVTIYSN